MTEILSRSFSGKFGVKVFTALMALIVFISIILTAYHADYQYRSMTMGLMDKGRMLIMIFADSSRIGAFSEVEDFLENPVNKILMQEDVIAASVYNREGKKILGKIRTGQEPPVTQAVDEISTIAEDIKKELRRGIPIIIKKEGNAFELYSRITSGGGFYREESVYYRTDTAVNIGYVHLRLDRNRTTLAIKTLMLKSILMGLCFLLAGASLAFVVVNKVTRPLNRLTEAALDLESGHPGKDVTINTGDEIGRLAKAFNKMSATIKRRERALQESESVLQELSASLISSQEHERNRISKELHDELGQSMALLKHQIRSIKNKLEKDRSPYKKECGDTLFFIDEIIESIRRLSKNLSPAILEDLGLCSALEYLGENFRDLHPNRVSIHIDDVDRHFSNDEKINIYRIFQEGFTNISRHAEADKVSFSVHENSHLVTFILQDDGKGFIYDEIMAGDISNQGIGLATMNQRARIINSNFKIDSIPGKGTTLALSVQIWPEGEYNAEL